MIFSNYFNEALENIVREVERFARQTNNYSYGYILGCAVECWCKKLQFSNEITTYIYNVSVNAQDLTNDIWSFWKPKTEKSGKDDSKFKKYIDDKIGNKMKYRFDDWRFLVFFGFLITAVGYGLYLLNQQSTKKDNINQRKLSADQFPNSYQQTENFFLILVINATKEDILQTLKANSRITSAQSDLLYRATQSLWMGSKTDFFNSGLEHWFYSKATASELKSEYDVYFVKIELFNNDIGLKSDANQVDRIDAFHRLPDNSAKLEVSDRLPSKAYENRYLYSR
ncbi:MAG: hypothetical protein KME29_06180 [Calothrix sp. FI2-JRJ7]|jgi:hypothetical protein|nr:hypothetical protein [Calothrix sp. FI2-JRJ7]